MLTPSVGPDRRLFQSPRLCLGGAVPGAGAPSFSAPCGAMSPGFRRAVDLDVMAPTADRLPPRCQANSAPRRTRFRRTSFGPPSRPRGLPRAWDSLGEVSTPRRTSPGSLFGCGESPGGRNRCPGPGRRRRRGPGHGTANPLVPEMPRVTPAAPTKCGAGRSYACSGSRRRVGLRRQSPASPRCWNSTAGPLWRRVRPSPLCRITSGRWSPPKRTR